MVICDTLQWLSDLQRSNRSWIKSPDIGSPKTWHIRSLNMVDPGSYMGKIIIIPTRIHGIWEEFLTKPPLLLEFSQPFPGWLGFPRDPQQRPRRWRRAVYILVFSIEIEVPSRDSHYILSRRWQKDTYREYIIPIGSMWLEYIPHMEHLRNKKPFKDGSWYTDTPQKNK